MAWRVWVIRILILGAVSCRNFPQNLCFSKMSYGSNWWPRGVNGIRSDQCPQNEPNRSFIHKLARKWGRTERDCLHSWAVSPEPTTLTDYRSNKYPRGVQETQLNLRIPKMNTIICVGNCMSRKYGLNKQKLPTFWLTDQTSVWGERRCLGWIALIDSHKDKRVPGHGRRILMYPSMIRLSRTCHGIPFKSNVFTQLV